MNNTPREQETIRALDVREQCRLRLPVWFGSRDNFYHGVAEVLANASDEITNNFEKGIIAVELSDDCETITIFDSGRGIPIGGETDGKKNYELLFCTLFSGTNYENLESGKIATGTNGVGTCVLNHCSSLFEVVSYKNFISSTIRFEDGGRLVQKLTTKPSTVEHGSKFTFKLDKEVFTHTVYDIDEIKAILNRLSGSNPKLEVCFKHKDEAVSFQYASTKEYIETNSTNSLSPTLNFAEKLYVEADGEKNTIQGVISLSTEPLQQTFLNFTYLKEGGTLYDGVIDGIRKSFNKDLKKVKLTNADIEMSFNFVVTIMSTNVEFANQTKFSSKKLLYKKIISDYVVENLDIIRIEQPKIFNDILKHLTVVNSFNSKNEESRKKVSKQLEEKATNATTRPLKLVPCRSKDPNIVELILIEGDSALNSVKLGRDANTMMVYPLKGKPMNVLKKTIDAILQNQEILDIFKILGCGITYKGKNVKGFPPFDIKNLMVKKILIATDFDDDGFHIQSLLIGVFYILAPQLLLEEIVVFIQTPLYIIKTKGQDYFAYGEQDRIDIINNLNGVKYEETRFKGLGGLPTPVMSKALKHETRESIVISMEHAKRCADKIELFLSDNVEDRKKYIQENGSQYVTETLLI